MGAVQGSTSSEQWAVNVDGLDPEHIIVHYTNIDEGLQKCRHVLAELEQCVADMQQARDLLTEVDAGGASDAFQTTSRASVQVVEDSHRSLGGTVEDLHGTLGEFSDAEMAGAKAFWNAQ